MENDRKVRIKKIIANRSADIAQNGAAGQPDAFRDMPGFTINAFTSRTDLLNKLFDPRRDIDEECGYSKVISMTEYRRMYDRGMGRRVVDVYPSETWKVFPKIYEDPDPENNTPFEEAIEDLDKRHHLLYYLQRADELSGIGHYGVILWGLDDGKVLTEPVDGHELWPEATGRIPEGTTKAVTRQLLFIRVFDESLVTVAAYERDVTNPRYGQPTHYNVTLNDPRVQEADATTAPDAHLNVKVHWSRITHVADNRKTSEVFGSPRQQPVWERLMDLRKIMCGSGEMFWKGAFPGISIETQPGLEGAEFDKEATASMMFDYMNGLQRYIALTGMQAKSLAPQIADPGVFFKVQIQAICVILGVPYRVFMGIEEGVVSGDQATKAWEGRLTNRQARYVTPMIINPVVQRLIDVGVLPATATPMDWTVEWPPASEPSALESAEVCAKRTEAFAKYVAGSVDTLIPPLEYLTLICGLDDETAGSIMEAAMEHLEDIAEEAEEAALLAADAQEAGMVDPNNPQPPPAAPQPKPSLPNTPAKPKAKAKPKE